MDVSGWNPRFFAFVLATFGVLGLAVGVIAGPRYDGLEPENRRWAVVTEVGPASSRLSPWCQVNAHDLHDPSLLYRFSSACIVSKIKVGDRLLLFGDHAEPPRYAVAREYHLVRPIFHIAGRAFSWHAVFGALSLILSVYPLTPLWQPERTSPLAQALIVATGALAGATLTLLFSLEDGRIAAATDFSNTLDFVVETTQEVPGGRFHGLLAAWYAIGHLADSIERVSVGISEKQCSTLVPGDVLQVYKTRLGAPNHVRVGKAETLRPIFSLFGRPVSWTIFVALPVFAIGLFFLWAAWGELRG